MIARLDAGPASKLVLASDCGIKYLPRPSVDGGKMRSLAEAQILQKR